MKTIENFWNVIGLYNRSTLALQVVICLFILFSIFAAYRWKLSYLPKIALAGSNLFIGIVFFLLFDKSPVGLFFACPLYLAVGILLVIDCIRYTDDNFNTFDPVSGAYLFLILCYPLVSLSLGHAYPKQVLYLLPCPTISFSIMIYSRYSKKSVLLLSLMTIWALTGLKAFAFNVLEDLILFSTAFYSIYLIWITLANRRNSQISIQLNEK